MNLTELWAVNSDFIKRVEAARDGKGERIFLDYERLQETLYVDFGGEGDPEEFGTVELTTTARLRFDPETRTIKSIEIVLPGARDAERGAQP